MVKNPFAKAGDIEMWVESLGWEDPLEKDMATYSSILAWRIPWTEEPMGLQSIGSPSTGHSNLARTQYTKALILRICFSFIFTATVVLLLSFI